MSHQEDETATLPIFCHACHGAVTVTYEEGEYQENTWACPHCGETNLPPMEGAVSYVLIRRLLS